MRKLFTLAVATLFASAAFANYDVATRAQKADSFSAEVNYYYQDKAATDHHVGLDFGYGIMEGLEVNLRMPTYTKDAQDEFVPSNPWLGFMYDVNDMFAVKVAGELAFIRDPKEMRFDLAAVYNMPVGDGLTFFAELGRPMGTGYTIGTEADKFGMAIGLKPGIKYAVDQFMAQFLVDFQQAVIPDTETYFGMSVNFAYMIDDMNCVFLGSSMPLSGVKYIKENNWLASANDEFDWTVMVGYKVNLNF